MNLMEVLLVFWLIFHAEPNQIICNFQKKKKKKTAMRLMFTEIYKAYNLFQQQQKSPLIKLK